jgi:hypothetical protein
VPNCKVGDIAKIIEQGANHGRMVVVKRPAGFTDDVVADGRCHLSTHPGECWVVLPLQALVLRHPIFMDRLTTDLCIAPDAWLKPIEGEPMADDETATKEAPLTLGAEVLTAVA